MDDHKLRKRWIIFGSIGTVALIFIGWFSVLMSAPIEDLCVASTSRVLTFHSPAVARWYLSKLASVKPDYKTETGLTLVQFVLNACEGPEGGPSRSGATPNCLATAEVLLRRGISIDARDTQFGFTALHNAVIHRDMGVTKWLLEKGANPNVVAEGGLKGAYFSGMTPLALAQSLLNKRKPADESLQEIVGILKAGGAKDIKVVPAENTEDSDAPSEE